MDDNILRGYIGLLLNGQQIEYVVLRPIGE